MGFDLLRLPGIIQMDWVSHIVVSSIKINIKGVEFVEAMQELGIIVDCSHLNDAGTEQLGDILDVPFVASHSKCT